MQITNKDRYQQRETQKETNISGNCYFTLAMNTKQNIIKVFVSVRLNSSGEN